MELGFHLSVLVLMYIATRLNLLQFIVYSFGFTLFYFQCHNIYQYMEDSWVKISVIQTSYISYFVSMIAYQC